MSRTDVPRDPGHYYPSDHAVQRAKERGIDWEDVAQAIAEGEIRQTHEPDRTLFVEEIAVDDERVGVVAHPQDGEIVTVEWTT